MGLPDHQDGEFPGRYDESHPLSWRFCSLDERGTGATIPFGSKDDGGDIVETSYLMAGVALRPSVFQQQHRRGEMNSAIRSTNMERRRLDLVPAGGQQTLYWNWSPNYAWAINVQVGGWSEALITMCWLPRRVRTAFPERL